MRLKFYAMAAFVAAFLISGCSHKGDIEAFENKFYSGDALAASAVAEGLIKGEGDDTSSLSSSDLLWGMNAGIAHFWADAGAKSNADSTESNADFDADSNIEPNAPSASAQALTRLDQAETLFSNFETEGLLSGVASTAGAVLSNDNVLDYRGNIYEGVLLNYYKALESMRVGKRSDARVEFNRANDRQRRAKDYYADEIAKAVEGAKSEASEMNEAQRSAATSGAEDIISKNYSNLDNFGAYAGFINPAVSYVSALFFMLENDTQKATDYFKEAYGVSKAQLINKDYSLMEARRINQGDAGRFGRYTWIIIEDGKGASKDEQNMGFDMPLGQSVAFVPFALPTLKPGVESFGGYEVAMESAVGATESAIGSDGSRSDVMFVADSALAKVVAKADEIADFESVVGNEFKAQLPAIVARAVASATTKALMQAASQSVASKDDGNLGTIGAILSIGTRLYSMATMGADVRMSTILPKKFYAIRMENRVGSYSLNGINNSRASKIAQIEIKRCGISVESSGETGGESSKNAPKNSVELCQNSDNMLYLRVLPNGETILKTLRGER